MHIACPEQSAPKEVLGEGYISDVCFAACVHKHGHESNASILHPLCKITNGYQVQGPTS